MQISLLLCCFVALFFGQEALGSCPPPGPIQNGGYRASPSSNPDYYNTHTSRYEYREHTRLTYTCNTGYRMRGAPTRTCGEQRDRYGYATYAFAPGAPSCDPIPHYCNRPDDPEYGYVHSATPWATRYNLDSWVTYGCNHGYCLQGDATVYCRRSGWSHTPSCAHTCPHRDPPSYGSYYGNSHNRYWCPGQSARYRCNTGFRMVGHDSSRCGSDGSWNYPVPSCKKVCQFHGPPQYGSVASSKRSYNEDEHYTYSCNPGYCRQNDPDVYCRHSGFSHSPSCASGCPHRDPPSYGSYYGNKRHWCPSDRARYRCNDGFEMDGEEWATCGAGGRWNYPVPRCRKFCILPADPQYASVVRSRRGPRKTRYSEDEHVTYRCNPGYCLYGNADVYCRHRGWGDFPTCKHVCPHRDPPSYGSYYGNNRYWCPGSRARYRCNDGFYMVGDEYSQCQDDGSWRSSVPRCRKRCVFPGPPRYGSVASSRRTYDEDQYYTYSCNVGYCRRNDPNVYCRHRGFSHDPSCTAGCPHRNPPSYGSYYYGNQTHWCPGDRARYKCNDGFDMVGEEWASCGGDGSWNYAVPRCRKFCILPADPQYASVVSRGRGPRKTRYNEDEYVTYRCNPGYCLHGDADVYCRHRGWGDFPRCRAVCPHRDPPSYGSYYGNNRYWCPGSRARYRCNDGFYMVGDEYSHCQDDGSWRSSVPRCRRRCVYPGPPRYGSVAPPSRRTYNEDEYYTYSCDPGYCRMNDPNVYCRHRGFSHSPDCRAGCPHRNPPSYGSYYGDQRHWCPGDRARYRCNDGFRMSGHEWASCGGDGSWDNSVPVCRKVCSHPSNPQYSSLASDRRANYTEGDKVTYRCNPGYCIYGDPDVYCRHRGWGDFPTCRAVCPHRDPPSYGSYYGDNRRWCPGSRARYRCNDGFYMVGDEYSHCQNDGSWRSSVPNCRRRCVYPGPPRYGSVAPPSRRTYNEDEYYTYSCNPGYCRMNDPNVYCRHRGFSHSPDCRAGCPHRDPPSYGSYYGEQRHWCPGDRARYKCNDGFRMSGHEWASCSGDGSWDNDVPVCRKVCSHPSNPQYSSLASDRRANYTEGDKVTYRCNPGYCIYGDPDVYCRHRGWGRFPTCRRACAHRDPPSYGSYYGNNTSWCPGQSARYKCNRGFRLYGDQFSLCGSGGSWSHGVPRCRRVCHRPDNPAYGYVSSRPPHKQEYDEDEYVTYGCNPGYCLHGDANVYCRHSGWAQQPACRRGCSHRNAPSYGGQYGSKSHWCPGDKARYFCNEHFEMSGYANSSCQSDGSWQYDVPKCNRFCRRPSHPQYGRVHASKDRYSEDEYVTYSCNPGYCMQGDPQVYCRHAGWGAAPHCRHGCRRRDPPHYGSQYGNRTSWCPSEKVRYKCQENYHMYGQEYSTCTRTFLGSVWNHDVPTCRRVCRRPSAPPHGYFSTRPKGSYSADEYVTIGCDVGYCGGGNMYCRHQGWADPPSCHHGCQRRDPPHYGSHWDSSQSSRMYYCPGDRARYKCQHGYEMSGNEYSSCTSDYSWDNAVPSCRRVCHLPSSPPHHGRFHSDPPNKRKFYVNDWVSVQCYSGYNRRGSASVYCRNDGWGPMPSCHPRAPTYPPTSVYRTHPTYPPHSTYPPRAPPSRSCQGKCGRINAGGCSCDWRCSQPHYNDCCSDYQEHCGHLRSTTTTTYRQSNPTNGYGYPW